MMQLDAPLALIGYDAHKARLLRELGLLALAVPTGPLDEVIAGARALKFAGALVAPALQERVYALCAPDAPARKVGRVDALSFAGGIHGTHTLEETLVGAISEAGYAARGATALIAGAGAGLMAALGVARLGVGELLIVAPDRPAAEQAMRAVPHGIRVHAFARQDPSAFLSLERTDLVIVAEGMALPPSQLQPYHTLLDLTGQHIDAARSAGATILRLADFREFSLAARVEHATGQRLTPEALAEAALTFEP